MSTAFLGRPTLSIENTILKRRAGEILHFIAEEDNCDIALIKCDMSETNPWNIDLEYSFDKISWIQHWQGTKIELNKGDRIYIRAVSENQTINSMDEFGYEYYFVINGAMSAYGSIMYLLKKNGQCFTVPTYCFGYLFSNCQSLKCPPDLPAETLADYCYYGMFNNCSSMTQAPALPAKILAEECYAYMFESCTSLTQAPELPATILAGYCYSDMFYKCSSIEKIYLPALNIDTNLKSYYNICQKCSNLKYLVIDAYDINESDQFFGSSYYPNFEYIKFTNIDKDKLFDYALESKSFGLQNNSNNSENIRIIGKDGEFTISELKTYLNECVSDITLPYIQMFTNVEQEPMYSGYKVYKTYNPAFVQMGAGHKKPFVVSKHILGAAWHTSGQAVYGDITFTHDDITSTVNRLEWINLRNWAIEHKDDYGWTESEINSKVNSDIALITCSKDSELEDVFIPYYVSYEKLHKKFYNTSIPLYVQTQYSEYAQPIVVTQLTNSSAYLIAVPPRDQWQTITTFVTDGLETTIDALKPSTHIYAIAWSQSYDSGHPYFIRYDNKDIVVGCAYGTYKGTPVRYAVNNFTSAYLYLKAFVESYGDELKTLDFT